MSRVRTFGRVTGLLSPQGESVRGSLADEAVDVTPALTARLTRRLPTNRLPQALCCSSSTTAGGGAGGGTRDAEPKEFVLEVFRSGSGGRVELFGCWT